MHAEPQPAELPLPGGREGATVRLHPLLTATSVGLPEAWFHREEGRLAGAHALGLAGAKKDLEIPIVAFLIEHPSAGKMLVDTGFHASVAVDAEQNLGRLNARVFKPQMKATDAVAAQLRAREIEPSEIKTVVMTHLHVDHASAISEFPGATFVFSAAEWEAAVNTPRPAFNGYVQRQFDHAFDFRTIEFEESDDDITSFATFGKAVDLFGDGSVRLVYTPGHSLGHISVILRLNNREALLVGDAAYTRHTIDTGHRPHRMADEHLFRRSLREIQIYLQQTPDALVIPGHDMGVWKTLEPVYY